VAFSSHAYPPLRAMHSPQPNTQTQTSATPQLHAGDAAPRAPIHAALSDIKLAHSVFALPFALLAAFLARDPAVPWSRFAIQLGLVVVCMVFARTWAMLINRWADRRFDADNPRTAARAIPSGRLRAQDALRYALLSALAFTLACAAFLFLNNPWPLILSLPTLAWIAFYAFTKRFTALCHLFLGGALAASPIAAAIAVRPDALADTPALWWIAGMVLVWVAGFDVIYALQDMDFDRRRGLRSIPAALGWRGANHVSRALHAAALAALVLAGLSDDRLALLYTVGVAAVAALLIAEHAVLLRQGQRGIPVAFFTMNGLVSLALGLCAIADILIRTKSV